MYQRQTEKQRSRIKIKFFPIRTNYFLFVSNSFFDIKMEHTRGFRITILWTLDSASHGSVFQLRMQPPEQTQKSRERCNQRSGVIAFSFRVPRYNGYNSTRGEKKICKQLDLWYIDSDPHKENRNPSVNSRSGIVIFGNSKPDGIRLSRRTVFVETEELFLLSLSLSLPLFLFFPLSFFSDSRSITIVVPLISTGKAINQ